MIFFFLSLTSLSMIVSMSRDCVIFKLLEGRVCIIPEKRAQIMSMSATIMGSKTVNQLFEDKDKKEVLVRSH